MMSWHRHPKKTDKPAAGHTQQPPKGKVYRANARMAVFSASDVLSHPNCTSWLQEIRHITEIPDEHFDELYVPLVLMVTQYAQALPSKHGAYLCSLLALALSKARFALQALQGHFHNHLRAHGQKIQHKRHLINYAVFSASLLNDMHKILSEYRVFLCDKEGVFIADWQPFQGPLEAFGDFYRLHPIENAYDVVKDSLAVMLGRQIMPPHGFNWLAEDTQIFVEWLQALRGDEGAGGLVLTAVQEMLQAEKEGTLTLIDLHNLPVDMQECPELKDGAAFQQWLENGIEDGSIKLNEAEAKVHVVQEGVFLELPELITEFIKIYGEEVGLKVVFQQWGNLLGIIKKGAHDFDHEQFFSNYQTVTGTVKSTAFTAKHGSNKSGVVVSDPHLVFKHGKVADQVHALRSKNESVRLPKKQHATHQHVYNKER